MKPFGVALSVLAVVAPSFALVASDDDGHPPGLFEHSQLIDPNYPAKPIQLPAPEGLSCGGGQLSPCQRQFADHFQAFRLCGFPIGLINRIDLRRNFQFDACAARNFDRAIGSFVRCNAAQIGNVITPGGRVKR